MRSAARWAAFRTSSTSAGRVARLHLAEEHPRVAQDDRQDVVEVVGHAARQLADGLELLRLTELILEALAVGEVERDRDVLRAFERRDGDQDRDAAAVLAEVLLLPGRATPCASSCASAIALRWRSSGGVIAVQSTLPARRSAREYPTMSRKASLASTMRPDSSPTTMPMMPASVSRRKRVSLALRAFLGVPPRATHRALAKLSLDDGREAGEPALEQVVVHAELHRFDRDLLTDRPRDDDERHVEVPLADHAEGARCVELGHREVGEDEVPRVSVERREHGLARLDALGRDRVARALQREDDERRVVLGVLDEKHTERGARGLRAAAAGGLGRARHGGSISPSRRGARAKRRGSAQVDTPFWRDSQRCWRRPQPRDVPASGAWRGSTGLMAPAR